MSEKLGFIVRVGTGAPDEPPGFLGSGFLVAPDRVLTCRHLVQEQTPLGQPAEQVRTALAVQAGDGPWVAVVDTAVAEASDLALLALGTALVVPAVPPFLWGLSQALSERLRAAPLLVIGYAQRAAEGPLWQHPLQDLWLLPSVREDTGILGEVQLHGGIPAGCSGSPVLLPLGEHWAYAGIVYLGGERAATSRLILADAVVEFLHRCGLHGIARLDAVRALAGPAAAALIERPAAGERLPNPYRGLAAFREADAPYFFGREDEGEALWAAVCRHPFVALVGASGSGKSSLLCAGLAPQARQADAWQLASFRPGRDPFDGLATALTPLLYPELDKLDRRARRNELLRRLGDGSLSLADCVAIRAEEHPEQRLLLIADQLEELFTQSLPEERRRRFLEGLTTAIRGDLPACLLISLRADFLGQALAYGPLAEALDRHPKKILGPMTQAQLRAAIEGPAGRLGVGLEPGLTERILQDLGEEPGTLPLLEFALTELWERQQSSSLTHGAYEAIGGVNQALAHHADGVLARYPDREPLRRIFVQLVRPGEGTEDTRQIATKAQVGEANWPLVKELADARLVVTDREEDTEQETLEVVHEALIRHWQPLREWIDADRQLRTWQNRLRQALEDWEDSGRDEGALLRGTRLAEAEEWLHEHRDVLSAAEWDYIQTSVEQREREAQTRRRARRLIVGSLAAGFLFAIVFGLWATVERNSALEAEASAQTQAQIARQQQRVAERRRLEAETERARAKRQQTLAFARQLAAQATLALTSPPVDLVKGTLLAVESLQRAQTLEGSRAWSQAMDLLPRDVLRLRHEGDVDAFAFSPDGRLLGTLMNLGWRDELRGWVRVLDVGSGKMSAHIEHDGPAIDIAFSSDGRLLASVGMDRRLVVSDLETGEQRYSVLHDAPMLSVDFSHDGELLAIGGEDGSVCVKTAETGASLFCRRHDAAVILLAFTPDGRQLITGSEDGTARVWGLEAARELRRFTHDSKLLVTALSPDGSRLATVAEDDPVVRIWDVPSGRLALELTHDARALDVAFGPGGAWVVTGGRDHTARIWDAETGVELSRLSHEDDVVHVVAVSPDGNRVVTVNGWTNEHEAIIWDTRKGEEEFRAKHDDEVIWAAFAPDGKTLISSTRDKDALWIWDMATGKPVERLLQQGTINRLRFSPDGRRFAAAIFASEDRSSDNPYYPRKVFSWGAALVWDVDSGELVHRFGDHPWHMEALAFDQNGERLTTADRRGDIKVWDLASSAEVLSLREDGRVRSLVFAPKDKLIVDTSRSTAVWDLNSKSRVADLSESGGVASIDVSTDGLQVITKGRYDEGGRVWDARTGKEIARLDPSQQLSPDGRLLGRIVEGSSVEVSDRESGAVIANLTHDMDAVSYRFDGEGRRLAVRLKDDSIALWDIATSSRIARIRHSTPVSSWDALGQYWFSPDGGLLATRSHDSTVRICETATGSPISELLPDTPIGLPHISFSDDGRVIATVTRLSPPSTDWAIRLWDTGSGKALFHIPMRQLQAFPVFSPDGTRIGIGSPKGGEVWDIAKQRRLFSVSHGGPMPGVRVLAFSSDGQWLATGGWDHYARIWHTTSGQQLQRLQHNDRVNQVAFAGGGAVLVTRDMADIARAWDPRTGKEMFRFAQGGAQHKTFYSRTGRYVATVSGSLVRLWDTETGEAITEFRHEQSIDYVALSPDGRLLAIVQQDVDWGDEISQPVQVWEVASGRELFRIESGGSITSLRFSADANWIVTGSSDNTARIWSAETGRELDRLTHPARPEHVILSDDNNYLAARVDPGYGDEKSFVVWHVPSRQVIARLPNYSGSSSFRAAFRPNGSELATSEGDSTFRIGDISSAQRATLNLKHEDTVFEVLFSPDSKRLATRMSTQGEVNYVPVWDLETGSERFRVEHEAGINDAKLTVDGKRLATASSENTARLWDMANGRELHRLSHPSKIAELRFSPHGRFVATYMGGVVDTGDQCDKKKDLLQVWDVVTGKKTALSIDGYIRDFLFSRGGRRLVTAEGEWQWREPNVSFGDSGWDNIPLGFIGVRVWDIGTGEELLRIPHENRIYLFGLSPDGTTLMTNTRVGASDTLRFADLATGRLRKNIPVTVANDSITGVVFTPDWKYVATRYNSSNSVRVWDVATGENLTSLVSEGRVDHMVFSPNGEFLLVDNDAHSHDVASVWDWKAGLRIFDLDPGRSVYDLGFTPDGSHIVTGGDSVQLWAWRAEDLVADACSRLERNLTEEEWRTYLGDEPYRETCPGLPIPEK